MGKVEHSTGGACVCAPILARGTTSDRQARPSGLALAAAKELGIHEKALLCHEIAVPTLYRRPIRHAPHLSLSHSTHGRSQVAPVPSRQQGPAVLSHSNWGSCPSSSSSRGCSGPLAPRRSASSAASCCSRRSKCWRSCGGTAGEAGAHRRQGSLPGTALNSHWSGQKRG